MAGEVWSFLEAAPGGLRPTAPKMAAEAARVANIVRAESAGVIIAEDGARFAEELAPRGLVRLYAVGAREPTAWTPQVYAEALAQQITERQPSLVLFAATGLGSEVAARVAARLGKGLIANCIDFSLEEGELIARKAVYDGKAHMTIAWSTPPPHIATVEPEVIEATEHKGSRPLEVIEDIVSTSPSDTELLRTWKTDPRQLDLTEASLVIGIGRPIIARSEELQKLRQLAEQCGAAFGVSRPVVDAGLLTKERQIGASGKWLSADVYIACGISGSSYHMAGVRQVRHLVAVNSDPNAPILKQAELGIVADLFEVIPALERLSAKDQRNGSEQE